MKVLILANHYNTLRIFRRELIKTLADSDHEIVVSIPECDAKNKEILESYGTKVVFTNFDRRGTNPIKDFSLYNKYSDLIRIEKPDKVITYTIKCNIYGGIACKKHRIDHYANITGLGSTFQSKGILRVLVSLLYKFSLNKTNSVFFENIGNRNIIVNDGIIKPEQAVVLPGAGVNLQEFSPVPLPKDDSIIRFLFVGRIMREKGVDEYFEAIKRIKSLYPNTAFDFIGWYEDDYEKIVKQMESEGLLKFYGFQSDVKPFIANSHCVVLPSWHEGMSNTLLESAAMSRPLITSDIHGCKEAVEEGFNGYLTRVKDSESIFKAIEKFICLSDDEREKMGINGRKRMEDLFDKNDVVKQTLEKIFA